MYTVIEMKKTIPQDLPTHWNICNSESYDTIASVWTSRAEADRICKHMNADGQL